MIDYDDDNGGDDADEDDDGMSHQNFFLKSFPATSEAARRLHISTQRSIGSLHSTEWRTRKQTGVKSYYKTVLF